MLQLPGDGWVLEIGKVLIGDPQPVGGEHVLQQGPHINTLPLTAVAGDPLACGGCCGVGGGGGDV